MTTPKPRWRTEGKLRVSEEGQFSLPFWPDHLRGVPWVALRTALFAPVKPGTRRTMQREELAGIGGVQIRYTGIQLDQADLDVYEQVLHIMRETPLGRPVEFRTRQLLADLGRSQGGGDREWLLKSLARMQACAIEFKVENTTYSGSLIDEQGRVDEEGIQGRHFVRLNPKIATLYEHGFSTLSWHKRLALGKNQLAKWLFSFAADLSRPLTFKVEKLMALSNSNYKRQRDFRAALEDAAALVREQGIFLELHFDKRGNVTLSRRSPTPTEAAAAAAKGSK